MRTEAVIDAVGLAATLAATLVLVAVLLLGLACSTGGYLACTPASVGLASFVLIRAG